MSEIDWSHAPQGAIGMEFRLNAAKEALRQAELGMQEVEKSRDSISKLGVSLFGWSIPISSLLAGIVIKEVIKKDHTDFFLPVVVASICSLACCFLASYHAFLTVRSKEWERPGIPPQFIIQISTGNSIVKSEAQYFLYAADILQKGISENERVVREMSSSIQLGWIFFLILPFVGVITALITKFAIYLSS